MGSSEPQDSSASYKIRSQAIVHICNFEAVLKVIGLSKTKEFKSCWLCILPSTRARDSLMKKLTFLENSDLKQPVTDFLENLNMRQGKIVKEVCRLYLLSLRH